MSRWKTENGSERGAVAVVVAIMLTVFIGFAALAVDVGYMMTARNELQNAADAAALAATRRLGYIYECGTGPTCVPMPYAEQLTYVANRAELVGIAQSVALSNKAAGSGIVLDDADVVIGTWDNSTKTLTPTLLSPDAVRVTVRRDGTTNGPIGTFFAKIFGSNAVNVRATGTAALTGESTAAPGNLPIPVGISKYRFESAYCEQDIKMYPTGTLDGCAGWHIYEDSPPNASRLAKLLDDLRTGKYQSPETIAGESIYNFTGGTIASAFDEMTALFDYMKTRDDDGNPNTWTTAVVVYDWPDCSNPNKAITIVGFATVVIHTVLQTPEKTMIATIKCDNVEPGRGGSYGTKGSIPGLVNWRDVLP